MIIKFKKIKIIDCKVSNQNDFSNEMTWTYEKQNSGSWRKQRYPFEIRHFIQLTQFWCDLWNFDRKTYFRLKIVNSSFPCIVLVAVAATFSLWKERDASPFNILKYSSKSPFSLQRFFTEELDVLTPKFFCAISNRLKSIEHIKQLIKLICYAECSFIEYPVELVCWVYGILFDKRHTGPFEFICFWFCGWIHKTMYIYELNSIPIDYEVLIKRDLPWYVYMDCYDSHSI